MELNLNVWKRGSQRAVHKPLLLLYALSQYQKGHDRFFSYSEIDEPLKDLLIEFGPYRKSHHPEYPFWRLQNDGFWELKNHEKAQPRSSNSDAKKTELLRYNVAGGLIQSEFDNIQNRDNLALTIGSLLDEFFPETIHEDIIEKLDITEYMGNPHKRDPNFRHKVLTAYSYKCAICGFDCRLGHASIGLEAAHIRWHQSNGPSTIDNGIAMCALHHKAFDRGVLTLTKDYTIKISSLAYGGQGFTDLIYRYQGRKFHLPLNDEDLPQRTYIDWHNENIFTP
ncbi:MULTISPECIES: phosphorothioated DNA-binding restriction endonuclease [unclassified Endozoicomonas]|uniref:phosphorothioated DNA-binding restriction endonuclease n=1 Tax=unclassified Endozoicomonas TaxID=2644528 RepID=UPI003BB5EB59